MIYHRTCEHMPSTHYGKFMHLLVGSWSEWFTTQLMNMCLLPTMEKLMHLQVAWQVKDLPQTLHVFSPNYGATRVFSGFVLQWKFHHKTYWYVASPPYGSVHVSSGHQREFGIYHSTYRHWPIPSLGLRKGFANEDANIWFLSVMDMIWYGIAIKYFEQVQEVF